jgi:hypothetical protein
MLYGPIAAFLSLLAVSSLGAVWLELRAVRMMGKRK